MIFNFYFPEFFNVGIGNLRKGLENYKNIRSFDFECPITGFVARLGIYLFLN